MEDVSVSKLDVFSALHRLSGKLSLAPDKLPAYFFKRVAYPFYVLTYLFNLTLSSGTLPTQWQCCIITPVYKKGSRDDPSHYRSVSLTSVLCRVLENIIAEKLTAHLFKYNLEYNLLSTNQFDFMRNRSTCSQLLIALNRCYKNFDDAIDVYIIYTDISKAFDTVSHPKLISVLQSNGVCNNVLNWITSFISYRKQCVCINDTFSSFCDITSGVPQGSVLGSLLFVVYIDNLVEICQPNNIRGDLHLYADNAKVYSSNAQELKNSQ